jgi:hypothetical protein
MGLLFGVVLSLSKHIPYQKKFITLRQAQGDDFFAQKSFS